MRVATILLTSLVSATWAQELGSINLPRTDGLEDGTATNDQNYGSCDTAAWPPTDLGNEIEATQPDEELQAALKEVDPERIKAIIEKLVTFGTRHTLSTQNSTTRGIGAARDWIASEFRKYAEASNGQMTVEVSGYLQPIGNRIPFPVRIDNIIATLKGSEDPSRVYVISGHHDSRVTDVNDYTSDSPGANDDASGVAVSMELARILATRRPKATIQFGSVAGEEQGLYGAAYWAQTLRNASVNVEAMITNDIIGSSRGDPGLEDPYTIRLFCQGPPLTEPDSLRASRLSIGGENDSPARQLGRYVAAVGANAFTGMSVAIVYRLDRFLRGGDHSAFLQQGYPGIRFTEPNENFAHQHQDIRIENGTQYGDLPEFVDYEFVSRVAKVNLATLWNLSNAPGKPRNVTVVTSTLGNDSELRWLPSNATDLAGYELVWRATTAPLWTHAVSVGKVSRVTVPLSKDNVIFGVRSVGTNGFKSPAVYPGPNPFPPY